MADRRLFPNAIDYVRVINDNIVDNALGRRDAFLLLPSLYQRAYILAHETGEMRVADDYVAPDESIIKGRKQQVNIITSDG